MMLSVIVTVRNEVKTVGTLLASLLAQTRRPDEIVIVDGGSTDGTIEAIEGFIARATADDGGPGRVGSASIRLLPRPGANIARGRNEAIRAAHGDLIACTDAGVRLEPTWLERLTEPFSADPSVDVSMGFFVAAPESAFERALGATTLPDVDEVDPSRFIPSSRSIAYTKRAWELVGGYPEWLDYCEDVVFDLALRAAGLQFAWVPNATVHFRPRSSARAFFRQYYLYARGDGKANLWPRRHLIRYGTYMGLPLVIVLGFWYKVAWLILFVSAARYLYRPYRRLARVLDARRPVDLLVAITLVPFLRLIGDVAKMVGYPVGVWWRARRSTSND